MNYRCGSDTSRLSAEDKARLLSEFAEEYSPLVKLGQRLGPAELDALLQELGGQKPHIPTAPNFWAGLVREVRDTRIRAEFDGRNLRQLSLEYDLSERQLREILAGAPRRYRRGSEPAKPVKLPEEVYGALSEYAERYGVSVRAVASQALRAALEIDAVQAALEEAFASQLEMEAVGA